MRRQACSLLLVNRCVRCSLFATLCVDDTPMVRRAAAKGLGVSVDVPLPGFLSG